MRTVVVSLALVACLFCVSANLSKDRNDKPYKVVCYWGSWSNYRNGDGNFVPESIDPNICTHLIYTFVKLEGNNRVAPFDPYLDLKENWGLGAYQRFNALREQNPHLTTLVAVGGWNEGSTKYSNMVSNPSYRKVFIDSVLEFLEKHGFDGFDVDWEYPANRGGVAADKQNYVSLLKELKEAFQDKGYLLSAAVSAGQATIDSAYDVAGVSKYLDFISVMAYDFHGGWDRYTSHNAPLYEKATASEKDKTFTVSYAIEYWIKQGADPKKIILGMPTYGRGWTLANANENGVGAPAYQPSTAGPFTQENGFLGYNEICVRLQSNGWEVNWDEDWKAPYMVNGNQWIGFDNIRSFTEKLLYAKSKGLGGAMIWSLESDDFNGRCGDGRFPLTSLMNQILNNGSYVPPPVTPRPVSSTKAPKPTSNPVLLTTNNDAGPEPTNPECPSAGFFRDPKDCGKFYRCGAAGGPVYRFNCPRGLQFHKTFRVCIRHQDITDC